MLAVDSISPDLVLFKFEVVGILGIRCSFVLCSHSYSYVNSNFGINSTIVLQGSRTIACTAGTVTDGVLKFQIFLSTLD